MADVVLATSEAWLPVLDRVQPAQARRRHARRLEHARQARRTRLGPRRASARPTQTLVVAAFGLTHPQQLVGHAAAALTACSKTATRIIFASLGHAPDELPLAHPRLTIVRPGPQDAADLARLLAASDLFLAPYSDGVSTRRTTLMAALQHGLCVVTTEGEDPRPPLHEPAMAAVPVADRAAFAALTRALAADPDCAPALRSRGARALRAALFVGGHRRAVRRDDGRSRPSLSHAGRPRGSGCAEQ